jgi:predicted nucleic-acid-binding protein
MAAIDTNVLVRFLIQDDEQQGHLAKSLIHQLLAEGETLFIAVTVLLELEWVLRSNFLFNKSQIIELLSNLLSTQELKFESLAHRAGHSPLWTFDKTASKVLGAKLLK